MFDTGAQAKWSEFEWKIIVGQLMQSIGRSQVSLFFASVVSPADMMG